MVMEGKLTQRSAWISKASASRINWEKGFFFVAGIAMFWWFAVHLHVLQCADECPAYVSFKDAGFSLVLSLINLSVWPILFAEGQGNSKHDSRRACSIFHSVDGVTSCRWGHFPCSPVCTWYMLCMAKMRRLKRSILCLSFSVFGIYHLCTEWPPSFCGVPFFCSIFVLLLFRFVQMDSQAAPRRLVG